jgi:hypothetical protein
MELRMKKWVLLALVLISATLYFPWRNNPLIFDDLHILKSTELFDYAINPFSILPRHFPYFTLGFENVLSHGDFSVSRCVSLVLHAINSYLLFLLGNALLKRMVSPKRAFFSALGIAVIFVIHPVAVYAVAYLIQRTILFATFFLLLSALQFDKALSDRSCPRAMVAGLCFGFAVLSKEHALGGLIVVMGILLINPGAVAGNRRAVVLSFLATALPFALWVASLKLGMVATAYEPDAQDIISAVDFPDMGSALGNWAFSASLQCLFFFRYLGFWYWPDPSGMSIDIRPDFPHLAHFPWLALGPVVFLGLAGIVVYFLWSKKYQADLETGSLRDALGLGFVSGGTQQCPVSGTPGAVPQLLVGTGFFTGDGRTAEQHPGPAGPGCSQCGRPGMYSIGLAKTGYLLRRVGTLARGGAETAQTHQPGCHSHPLQPGCLPFEGRLIGRGAGRF